MNQDNILTDSLNSPTSVKCTRCYLPLLPEENFCPRCFQAVNDRVELQYQPYYLTGFTDDLDHLLMSYCSLEMTDAKLMEAVEKTDINIEEHPIYHMVMEWNAREKILTCEHKSHTTEEKREICIRKQCAKETVRTIWHNLCQLERLKLWSSSGSTTEAAIWTCNERHEEACNICRQREGIIISVSAHIIPVLHPRCNCSLMPLSPGNEHDQIGKMIERLSIASPWRAQTVKRNVARCIGITDMSTLKQDKPTKTKATAQQASNSGCGIIILLPSVMIIIATIFWRWLNAW